MSDFGIHSLMATACLSAGFGGPTGPIGFPSRRDWSHITHTYTEKPLSKRRKRRLRGKGRSA